MNTTQQPSNLMRGYPHFRKSLAGYKCPYCWARRVHSELVYLPYTGENLCPTCGEVLVVDKGANHVPQRRSE